MTEKPGCSVLRLSPYRYILNPLEMARASLNFCTSQPSKFVNLTDKENIPTESLD